MKQKYTLILFVVLMVVPLLTASVAAQGTADLPTLADLTAGEWAMIPTGGDTICATGTPYAFFVRPANQPSEKLLLYFQGGGFCDSYNNCTLDETFDWDPYDPFVDEKDYPTGYDGIFNFQNEENPFLNYNMVMVAYCTGDMNLGNRVATYTSSNNQELTIQHKGFVNTMAVLDWMFANIEAPETVFVTGCGDGAAPTPFYTALLAEAHPNTRFEQLADAFVGYLNPDIKGMFFEAWGTADILTNAYAGTPMDEMSFAQFYIITGSLFPDVSLTQYNTYRDNTHTGPIEGLIERVPFPKLLETTQSDIKAKIDNFSTYTAGGVSHCITPSPNFYTYTVGDTRFRDWVAALAAGEEVEDVTCVSCAKAELYKGK